MYFTNHFLLTNISKGCFSWCAVDVFGHQSFFFFLICFFSFLLVILDLGFMIDGSSAVGSEQNFKQIIKFVSAVIHAFPLGHYKTRVGLVVCSSEDLVVFNFYTYFDMFSIDQALSSVKYPGTNSAGKQLLYLGRGLEVSKHFLFDSSWRNHVPRLLVMVVAGNSADSVATPSMEIRSYGVEIFCIGVGSVSSNWQLNAMASYPYNAHVFKSSYEQMGKIAELLVTNILRGKKEILSIRFPFHYTQRAIPSYITLFNHKQLFVFIFLRILSRYFQELLSPLLLR